MTMQYIMGIPPQLRSNVDYVFILRENVFANRKRIYDNYAGMFPSFDIFCQVLNACTENYECLVIHNGSKSNKLTEQVYWYKADPHKDFKMCLDCFWQKSESEFNPEYNINTDDLDDDDYRTKKKNRP